MNSKKIYRIIMCIISLSMIISFVSPIYASQEDTSPMKIKVAFYQLDGFFEYDENGNECGYGVDYLNELKKYINVEWEYVPVDSWEDIAQMMESGQVDVKMPVSEPTTPSKLYDYTVEPIMYSYHAIMTLKDDVYYQDYDKISKMKIGAASSLMSKITANDYLNSKGIFDNLIYFKDYNSCYDDLKNGKIDALVSNIMDQTGDMKVLDRFTIVNNYIITLKGNPCFSVINSAMTQMKLENPSLQTTLYAKYYPERTNEPFTKEEAEYIDTVGEIDMAVYSDRKPVSYYDEESGEFKGIAIDIANLISHKIGIKFNYVPITTDEPVEMLDSTTLVMPVSGNANSNKYFVTTSMIDTEVIMAVRVGNETIEANDTIGVLSSTPGILSEMKNLGKFRIKEYESNKEALKALQNGDIAAFANSSFILNWLLENPLYSDLDTLHYQSFPIVYEICGNRKDIILQSILNKGIYRITEEEKDKIIQEDSKFTVNDMSLNDKLFIYRKEIVVVLIIVFIIVISAIAYNHSRTKYIHEIENSRIKLEEANHAKSEFLSRMSHDMRTPLNVIMGMSNIASDNDNPQDTKECLKKIDTASEFLLGLINDVLDMEHIESGKMQIHMVPYSGEEFAQYISAVINPLCQQKNINFEYTYSGVDKFVILQDKLRINQVYFNLLSNAVKFTPEGGKISFHTDIELLNNNKVKMKSAISDTGIGMSEEFQQRMFEPFSQENQVFKPIGESTGLGLSIVKRICDMMNMEISVKSELGKGTTFYIEGEYDIATDTDINAAKEKNMNDEANDSLNNKTFLVCEDHPLNQEIIKRLLEKKGAIVIIADDGKRGIEAFSQSVPGNFTAILMDIRMPIMNGLEATRAIRSLGRDDAKTVPIIAMTANAYEEDIQNCIDAGMNEHLAKPIDPQKLYATLQKYV